MSGSDDEYALGIVFFWLCWEKTFQGKGRPWQTYSDFKVETGGCYFEVLTIACCAGSLQVTQDKIDFQSVPNPVFILDIGEPTTFANQSLDTGFSSFKSSNFGWLKGKQTQTWWQSHTQQNTHVHTEKEGQSSKRAISQSINESIKRNRRKQQKTGQTNKQKDKQTNKQNRLQRQPFNQLSHLYGQTNRSTSTLRNRLRGMSHTNLHLAIASLVYASWVKKWLGSGRWYMNCCFNDLCSGLLRNLPLILELDEIFWFEILK